MGNSSSSHKSRKCRSLPTSPEVKRQLPVPYSKVGANGGTAIPLPATVLVQRRCPPDKVRPLPPTPGHSPSVPGLSKSSGVNSEANSRPASPPGNGTPTHIPKGNNSFRPVQGCKIPASPYSVQNNPAHLTNGNVVQNGPTKHSMLDKLKLFNKEKSDRSSKTQTSKRTSSSSGFSSARSERSDSSLSLNDGQQQQLPKLISSKKPDVSSAKSKSKLLSSKSGSKDSVSSKSKSDRKDKSPARTEEPVSETKIVPPRIQKIPTVKVDSKIKSIPPPKKLETRSESKSSLSQMQMKPTPPPTNCTNIPKPMAFIKGTTKPTIKIEQTDGKPDKMNISNQNISTSQDSSKFQIVAPISAVENQTIHHMHQQLLNGQNISMTDSSHSKSTHSSSTGLHSNSSESSVIYRPSSESGSDALYIRSAMSPLPPNQNVIPNRKIDNFDPPQPMMTNEKAQKFHTVPSKMLHGNGVIFEEERQMTVLPMRPLLRGYNSHVTLPTRGMRGQNMVSDYCEDIGQGYCSDGDALRKIPSRYSDIENGYMSEGGSCGIHAKHMSSIMRTRTQLPTTIEERCRSSRGENLDCMGTVTSPHTMELNGCNRTQQRNSNRENWGKIPEQQNGHNHQSPSSPTSSRKDKGSPSHSRRSTSSSKSGQSRTKGVPQSFGYVKRTNGSAAGTITATDAQQAMMMNGGRTAHVSAVPRSNKVKVSGGTQTCTADLQSKIPPNTQHRSFSLTGPGAAQLSQSIRERLSTGSHSLPKQASDLHVFQHRISNRGSVKLTDGSLSDTQAYAEVKTDYSSYAMWLKHSNTASSRLSEGDSLESLGIGSPRGHKMMHRESPYSNSPRLNRSNSISYLKERTYPRSTKSEKMYPSMLSRGPDVDIEPYYCLPVGTVPSTNPVAWSQPTSPTPPNRGFGGPLSPTHAGHRLTYPKKNDDAHGSAASLLSGGSSLYGSAEERQLHEVRRLKRELVDARDQVMSLSSQLSTNAHVVAAFEQSLTNMTQRLQQLSATADRKDGELTEMRQTIELLRKQSIQAGLTSAHMHSMNEQPIRPAETIPAQPPPTSTENAPPSTGTIAMQRHLSSDSMCSLNSVSSGCSAQDKKKKKGWLRSSFTKAFSRNAKISKTNRHHSTASNLDHLSSANSSGLDTSALPPPSPSRSPLKMVTVVENAKPADAVDLDGNPIVEDLKKQLREKDLVLTDIRLEALSSASQLESLKDTVSKMRQEMMNLKQNNERLQKLVTSRSLAGSEVSLGGPISPSGSMGEPRRYSLADGNLRPPLELPKSLEETEEENIPPAPAPEPPPLIQSPSTHSELTPPPTLDHMPAADHISTPADDIADHTDGKKIAISVYLAQPESFAKYAEEVHESDEYYANDGQDDEFDSKIKSLNGSNRNEFVIAYTYISGKTTWQNLDYIVRKTFKDYVARIDPGTNLGLNTDSITSYHLGEAKRGPEMGFPELLPCGYIVGNVKSLYICLQGVGSLAFDSLIPRSIVHRYISLLTEHRRLILCGPSGTGKSYLARKLAEFLVARSQRGNPSEAIATFNVDHKSSKELRQYLGHIAEQASMSNGASELPSVIILDNLHHASALGDVFQVLLSAGPAAKLPCIIGTMSQATCNTTNLQLHHNFRWVLTANHMEPVKGFLARFLRRRLYSLELSTHNVQPQLAAVLAWLPTVWQHINRFLETHSSSDVTIGPRLFLSCPLDLIDSQVWFTDIWNYHLEPYLVEAVREGVQLYGRRVGAWVDPSTYIRETYPWTTSGSGSIPPLRLINAEDVGLEGGVTGNLDSQDPLLNMLMRLQEAANYSGNQEQESDCASLDSNITQDSSAGAE
ncbi:protein sickie isoform X5 [Bradysia coprophila]|uniref:protein sickie isoform X5 n=1 Tax=Bradysia coprophila TaxID=38358 RepID=UPI00187D7395|nr:protein sickie isoform X5 [Bradysia coprophila]